MHRTMAVRVRMTMPAADVTEMNRAEPCTLLSWPLSWLQGGALLAEGEGVAASVDLGPVESRRREGQGVTFRSQTRWSSGEVF